MKLEKEIKKTIIKTIEVPLGRIEKMEGGIMRALITAEIPDADGDVVVVKGMSWPRYNETNPLPVLSSHLRKLPDGKPPQVGFAKVIYAGTAVIKGESVPAVFMEWEEIVSKLVNTAMSENDEVSLRAISELFNRAFGKPVSRSNVDITTKSDVEVAIKV